MQLIFFPAEIFNIYKTMRYDYIYTYIMTLKVNCKLKERHLMKSFRSSLLESGLGFFDWSMLQASNLWFTAVFPPYPTSMSTWSSVHSSSFTDRTFDMWTPRLLCTPEHFMQINTPRLNDLNEHQKRRRIKSNPSIEMYKRAHTHTHIYQNINKLTPI